MSGALVPTTPGNSGPPQIHQRTEGGAVPENPLLLVHKLLRGRYIIAIVLALVLGPVGGAIGYLAVQLEYTSTSTIRIAPVLQKILFESDENSIPMFDSYLQTQVSLIGSRRVMEMAMQSETWREVGGGFSLEELEEFTKSLTVAQPKGSQLIAVSFSDGEAARARAGAKAVVDAYTRVYVDSDVAREGQRFKILDDRANTLRKQIVGVNEQIQTIAREYGSDDLSGAYDFEMNNLQTIQTELEAAKLQLNSLEAVAGGDRSEDVVDYTTLSVEEIALIDVRMRSLIDERSRLQREIGAFEATLRKPETRAEYRQAVTDLKEQETEIEAYATAFRESPLLAATPSSETTGLIAPTATAVTQLRSKVEGLQKLYEEANKKRIEIGGKNITLKAHRTELARLEDDLELTNSRIEQLSLEGSESGRVSVLAEAEVPGSPSNAKRRIQLAILGGLAGAGLGVALVIALGFLKSNIRDITDAQSIEPRLLGALPLLPQTLTNAAEVVAAAQAVHHIRTILHAHMPRNESLCLTVTGSNSGAGKTSFALSLGLSFATAGTRTLIIDGDVVGMGLTRRTGATGRRKLGHVLRSYEVITEEESRHALQIARQTGRRLGHALIELGYISESDLQDGLAMQSDVGLGLADALNGEHVENCLADIGVPGLTILPASRRTVAHSHSMSPVAFRKLLDELRPMFDIILIDSGPVPGLPDAMIMSMCADGVIMMASRGDSETEVQRALKHLNELGVPVVGLVFNRADAMDIERSKYSMSSVSSGGREKVAPTSLNVDDDLPWSELLEPVSGFGPLAQSVWLSTTHASSMSPSEINL